MSMRTQALLPFIAILTLYLVWGSTYVVIGLCVETIPPMLLAGVRFGIAGALMYGYARLSGTSAPSPRQWLDGWLIGSLFFLGGNGMVCVAQSRGLPSGIAALQVASMPLWLTVIAWLIGRSPRPSLPVVLSLLGGFAGVVLLIGGRVSAGAELLPAAIGLLAPLCWATGSALSLARVGPRVADRPKGSSTSTEPKRESAAMTSGVQMLGGAASLFVGAGITGEMQAFELARVTGPAVVAFAYLVVVGSMIAFSAYRYLLRTWPPARVATYAYVNPVVAVVLGWVFAGEELDGGTMLAMTLILASVAATNVLGRRGSRRVAEKHTSTVGAPLLGEN